MSKQTILVIAAHPDDEVLGCGGSIAGHVAAGDEVHVVIMAQGLNSRGQASDDAFRQLHAAAARASEILGVSSLHLLDNPDNRMDMVPLLEVTQQVEGMIARYQPDCIYTHFAGDLNIDHRRTNEAVITACRPLPAHPVRRILCFEVPSSTEWASPGTLPAFYPNWFNDISVTLDKKLAALAAYADEMRAFPHPRSLEAVRHLAAWRGASGGYLAAEAFVLARQLNEFKLSQGHSNA